MLQGSEKVGVESYGNSSHATDHHVHCDFPQFLLAVVLLQGLYPLLQQYDGLPIADKHVTAY